MGVPASSEGNATKLLNLHPYETTVVHEFYDTGIEARLNFFVTAAINGYEQ